MLDINVFIQELQKNSVHIFPFYDPEKEHAACDVMLPYFEPTEFVGYNIKHLEAQFGSNTPDVSFNLFVEGMVWLDNFGEEKFKGCPSEFATRKFMLFRLFKDGQPCIPALYCNNITEEVENTFKQNGLTVVHHKNDEKYGAIFKIGLNDITFASAMALHSVSAYSYASHLLNEARLKAKQKVYNFFLKELGCTPNPQESIPLFSTADYDQDMLELLERNHITPHKGFSPPFNYKSPKPAFEVKLSGLSNLPKVEEVVSRLKEGKKQTTAGVLMVDTVKECTAIIDSASESKPVNALIIEIQNLQKATESSLEFVSHQIKMTRYAMHLKKLWFTEFTEKSDNTIKIDEVDCNFVVTKTEDQTATQKQD